jgi:DNA-binding transcriptional MerR regulator
MLKIGEFARLGNVSIRALRFYHEEGLLTPAHVDPASSYRSYDTRQLRELQDIHLYKDLRFSLAEIRKLLREKPSPAELRGILSERRIQLKQRIQEDYGRLARIDARLQATDRGMNELNWRVELREIQPVWVAASREKIRRYDEADEMFIELERRVGMDLLSGKRAAFWHTCESDGPQIDCEAVRFLKCPVGPLRGIRTYQMPAARVASVFHTGTEQTIPQAYKALQVWVKRSGFISDGPKCEIYWIEPRDGKIEESLTEIRLPLFPVGNHRRGQGRATRGALTKVTG